MLSKWVKYYGIYLTKLTPLNFEIWSRLKVLKPVISELMNTKYFLKNVDFNEK